MIKTKFIGILSQDNEPSLAILDHVPFVGEEVSFEGIDYTVFRRKWFFNGGDSSLHIWVKEKYNAG